MMNRLAIKTLEYLKKDFRKIKNPSCYTALSYAKHRSLSFNLFRCFTSQNKSQTIEINQTFDFNDIKSELFIENQETRQVNELLANGKYTEAVLRCKEILNHEGNEDQNRIRYLLAYSLKQIGKSKEAIESFKSFIKNVESVGKQQNNRDNLEIFVEASHLELAQLYYGIGKMNECLDYTEKAIQYNPVFATQQLIEPYVIAKQIERGIKFLKAQHERVPQNEPILFLLGFLQEIKGDIEDALQSYQKLIDISDNQSHPEANLNVGMILKRKGDYETSTCYLLRTIESDPKNYKARFNLGQNLRFLGEGMLGKENLEACIEIDPNNSLPYYDLALCYEQIGEMDKCVQYLQKNVEANDTHFESYLRLANIYAAKNDKQQSLNFIKMGINSDDYFRENINCINLLQALLEKDSDFSQIESKNIRINNSCLKDKIDQQYKLMEEQFLNLNLQKNQKKCEIYNFFTQLFLLTNHKDLAIESEKRLVEFNINVLQHRVNLASLYRSKLQLNDAINEYKELIKIQPEEGNYHYFCGQIQLQAGMLKEAIVSYNMAINIQGENDYSLYELYNCYKLNNQMDEATSCKNTLLQYFPDFFTEEKQHIDYIESLCIKQVK